MYTCDWMTHTDCYPSRGPSCRSALVDTDEYDDHADTSADSFIPIEPFNHHSWQLYSDFRERAIQDAEHSIQWDTGPVYQIIHDDMASQIHQAYQQVGSRSLSQALGYRYDLDGRSREMLWDLATSSGVDSFRCYRAPADSGVDYFLTADYLDEHTRGVRRVRACQPIPGHVLEMQRQIAVSGTVQAIEFL